MLGGAVGGIVREDLPQIVANIVQGREQDLELWIRPERFGHGYTVERTTVEFDPEKREWQSHEADTSDVPERQGSLRDRYANC